MTTVTVSHVGDVPEVHATAIATLPESLTIIGPGGPADVVLVGGPVHRRPLEVSDAFDGGARAVVVDVPVALTSAEAEAMAAASASAGATLVAARPYVWDPGFAAAEERVRAAAAGAVVARVAVGAPVSALHPAGDLEGDFAHVLALVRLLGEDVPAWAPAFHRVVGELLVHVLPPLRSALGAVSVVRARALAGGGAAEVDLLAGDVPVAVTLIEGPLEHWSVDLAAHEALVQVSLPRLGDAGRAATVTVHDAAGMLRPPPAYESGMQAMWRQVANAVTDEKPFTDLGVADLAIAEDAVRLAAGAHSPLRAKARVALAGAGMWSLVHMAAVSCRAEVASVASRRLRSARARAAVTRASAGTLGDDTWLDGADAAIVCTVPAGHAAPAAAAIERGVPVIIEKPLAATLAEARRLAALARDHPAARVLYGENWLFQPVVQRAVGLARQRAVTEVTVRTLHPPPPWGSYLVPGYGGGVVFDLGSHPIELARALLGRPDAEWVEATMVDDERGVDVEGRLLIGFEGGRLATVEVTWTAAARTCIAEGGGVVAQLQPVAALTVDGRAEELPASSGPTAWMVDSGFLGQVEALLGDRPVEATVEDGVAVMEIVYGAYASARHGRRTPLPFDGDASSPPEALRRGGT